MTSENYKKYLENAKAKKIPVERPSTDAERQRVYDGVFTPAPVTKKSVKKSE